MEIVSKREKQKTAQNPVMVRPKNVLRSNILKPIKTNNKAFSRNQKPTREPIKLKHDQGVQGVPQKGKATAKQLVFAGIFTAELGEGLTVTWWYHSNAEAEDTPGDHPSNPPA